MKRVMTVLVVFSFAISLIAQGNRGPAAMVSPWPLYPANGAIPAQFADRHVFLDRNGDALVILTDETGNRHMYRRELENHVAPGVVSSVTKERPGTFTYEYNIQNGPNARQRLIDFSIATVPEAVESTGVPGNWGASKTNTQPRRLTWFAKTGEAAVTKGSAAVGFTASSILKPGLTFAYFRGLIGESLPGGPPNLNFEIPNDVQSELSPTTHLEFNSVPVLTIGPKFSPTSAKQEIAADFHVGISRLINRQQLESKSRWVIETLDQLKNFIDSTANGVTASIIIRQQPTTPLEREISNALKLSLDLQ